MSGPWAPFQEFIRDQSRGCEVTPGPPPDPDDSPRGSITWVWPPPSPSLILETSAGLGCALRNKGTQGRLQDLRGPVHNKNVRPLVQKVGKTDIEGNKTIHLFPLSCGLSICHHDMCLCVLFAIYCHLLPWGCVYFQGEYRPQRCPRAPLWDSVSLRAALPLPATGTIDSAGAPGGYMELAISPPSDLLLEPQLRTSHRGNARTHLRPASGTGDKALPRSPKGMLAADCYIFMLYNHCIFYLLIAHWGN